MTMSHAPTATGADLEHLRPRLFGLAYRMLGDAHDAEDVVQEGFLRWHQADRAAVEAPEGWMVSVVTRLAIDRLRRARTERRTYVGPWLPEPVATAEPAPDRAAELASDLSIALLVLLERLAPEERAAFLLREVFDVGYPELARILERSEPATRQMVHRARERVRTDRARFAVPPEAHERILRRFLDALASDDEEGLLALLAPDATFTSDGGGKVYAARRVIVGAERIARLLLSLQRKGVLAAAHEIATVNGAPALLTRRDGRVVAVTTFAVDGTRIVDAYRVLNPDKLRRVEGAALVL